MFERDDTHSDSLTAIANMAVFLYNGNTLSELSEWEVYVMKRISSRVLFITVIAILILVFSTTALAHPGGTDKYGGHTESATGQYHYHHGHEAHQHPDGVCPFGDYDEWLKEHGVTARPLSEEPSNTGSVQSSGSSSAWDEVGIGLGAAGAAAIGYGVYRKNKKKKTESQEPDYAAPFEDDSHTKVYVANNGTRYHKRYGCCNAMLEMELGKAKAEGRIQCPLCYNDELYGVMVDIDENNKVQSVSEEVRETIEDNPNGIESTDQGQQSPQAS